MSKKENKKVEEPIEIYEVSHKSESALEDLNPVLVQLIEKSIKDIEKGHGIFHEEMKSRIKIKYPFLK